MSRTRLYTDTDLCPGAELTLEGGPARYLGRVLRLRVGDELTLFNGRGGEYPAVLQSLDKASVTVALGEFVDREAESSCEIHLLQGLARGERMDLVVQKCTELGVRRITPLSTDHGVVRLDGKRARKRVEHWRGIAASACEQCGRNRLPEIDEPTGLRDWLGQNFEQKTRRLILRPGTATPIGAIAAGSSALVLLIGPEGGFSESEYELADATGFEPVALGPRILRTETAAIAAVAALQVLFGDMG